MVTWDFPSGRRYGRISALRTSARRLASLCASRIGIGMSSAVSVQANPNIMPWSPAPWVSRTSSSLTSLRTSRAEVTPWLMSGDWAWMAVMTPLVSES